MNDTPRNGTTGLVLAFLAGAVSGAVVALLTAPGSGRQTRGRLKDLAQDAADRAARVPPAVNQAFARAAEAAHRSFVEVFEAEDPDQGSTPGRRGH